MFAHQQGYTDHEIAEASSLKVSGTAVAGVRTARDRSHMEGTLQAIEQACLSLVFPKPPKLKEVPTDTEVLRRMEFLFNAGPTLRRQLERYITGLDPEEAR